MADPRFYDNRGPFTLGELCAKAGIAWPDGYDETAQVIDVAALDAAGPQHLTFFDGKDIEAFAASRAGWCLIPENRAGVLAGAGHAALLPARSMGHAFAAAARLFYPEHELGLSAQDKPIHPTARLDEGVVLEPGVVIGPGAEIGLGTRIGANSVIGRGVTLGRNCEIGSGVWIGFSHMGDHVLIQPGARIGASGYGFQSNARGHTKTPQLGRVIVQDHVEIGLNSAVARGALGDTVIGEGTKIDNLVHIAHNVKIGRHCLLTANVGVAGSVQIGDFVAFGGGASVAPHLVIGDGARIGGMAGVTRSLEGGKDYSGHPARPLREWLKGVAVLRRLAERGRSDEES